MMSLIMRVYSFEFENKDINEKKEMNNVIMKKE
jgi:hypothetical protein